MEILEVEDPLEILDIYCVAALLKGADGRHGNQKHAPTQTATAAIINPIAEIRIEPDAGREINPSIPGEPFDSTVNQGDRLRPFERQKWQIQIAFGHLHVLRPFIDELADFRRADQNDRKATTVLSQRFQKEVDRFILTQKVVCLVDHQDLYPSQTKTTGPVSSGDRF